MLKKLILLLSLPMLIFAQDEQEMLQLYQQMTGKTIDEDMINQMMQSKYGQQSGSQLMPTMQQAKDLPDSIVFRELKAKKDSVKALIQKGTYFEKYVRNHLIDPYDSDLQQFSVDFKNIRSNANILKRVPDKYILNYGDVLVIEIWGAINKTYQLELNNEGYVIIPDIGKVDIGSLSYGEAKAVISQKLSTINGIKYSVRLRDVKPVTIYVVGNVAKPGIYNISPFIGVMEILAMAGGIQTTGSYRNIKIVDKHKKTRNYDLYNLLFEGQLENLVFETDMLIFVPLVDKQIAVAGNVKKEGIYEYKAGEKLSDILKYTGSAPFADLNRIEIERISKNKNIQVLSTSIKENPALQDGDVVRVFSSLVYQQDYVYLKGSFRQNKKIEYKAGLKLADIIASDEDMSSNTNINYGAIIRKDKTGDKDYTLTFSPLKVLNKEADANIEICSRDTVKLFTLEETTADQFVKINGEVKNPGLFKFTKDMSVRDLIYAAGGYDYKARIDTIEVAFPVLTGSRSVDLQLIPESQIEGIKLVPNAFVFIRKIPDFVRSNQININGRIKYPGSYMINQSEKLADIIKRAGGTVDNAHLNGIRIFRKSVKEQQEEKLKKLKNELKIKLTNLALSKKAVVGGIDLNFYDQIQVPGRVIIDPKNDDMKNFSLQDGDSIYIPSITNTVLVMGEVVQETAVAFSSKENNPAYYMKKAGGISDFADEDNIHIIKANGEVMRDDGWFASYNDFQVEPGDIVFVPYDYTKLDNWQITKDVVNILYQLSVAVATTYNATK